jgi:transcriptional regulator with XRE-family HTH domain
MLDSAHVTTSKRDRPAKATPTPAQRLRELRTRLHLTQEQVATRAGRHVNTIANLEDDAAPDRLTTRAWKTVAAVAQVLNTTPEDLGYREKRAVRPRTLTPEQRDVIAEIVALPTDDLKVVRDALRSIEQRRGKKGKR